MKTKLINEEKEVCESLSKEYRVVAKQSIKEKIEDEVVKWRRKISRKLNIENPFYENQKALEKAKEENSSFFLKNLKDFKSLFKIVGIKKDFNFWNDELAQLQKMQKALNKKTTIQTIKETDRTKTKIEVVKKTDKIRREEKSKLQDKLNISNRLLLQEWEKELLKHHLKWELEAIENYRKELLQKLKKWLDLVQKMDNLLCDLSIDTGVLFDLSDGNISLNDIEQLKKWVEYVSKDKGVKELCDMLGRLRKAEQSSRKETIKTNIQQTEYIPDINSNEEIVGIRLGRDIEHTLPQELALLGDSETSILFDMKYIEGKLMCFDMEGVQEKTFDIEVEQTIEVTNNEKLGPIIICVDTSGSMSGSPETIAKAVTLYMATRAIQQKRDCFLINFSTSIETLDLSNGIGLVKVLEFLRKSFNGGTDVAPALNHALGLMKEEKYKKSDLLIISDFIMSSLSDTMKKDIEKAKIEKNKFYSLSIGNLFLESRLKDIFDDEWVYNPQDSSIYSICSIVERI